LNDGVLLSAEFQVQGIGPTPVIDEKRSIQLTKEQILFLFAMIFVEASRSMTVVQIPVFLRELGASVEQVGTFFTLALIFPLLLRIFGGWVSDRLGRLQTLWIGCFAGSLTYLTYTFASSWQLALLAPAMLAISTALTIPSYYAYIGDTTKEGTRGRVFGLAEAIRTSAWIFSPPLGGFLAQKIGYQALFLVAAGSFTVSAFIFLTLARGRRSPSGVLAQTKERPSLIGSFRQMAILATAGGVITWILIADGVRDVSLKISFELMPVYLTDIANLTKQDIGLLDGIFGVAWVVTSFPAGWLVDKTSERVGIVVGICLQLASRFVFFSTLSFYGFAFSWILLGIGGALLDPAFSSLIARSVPQKLRGITYGLTATTLGLISLPFPWIGGQLWTMLGPKAPFMISVVLGSLSVIPAWKKLKAPKNGDDTQQTAVSEG
jgi:DHA1 family multidrug resistance protein-like MFS transporter